MLTVELGTPSQQNREVKLRLYRVSNNKYYEKYSTIDKVIIGIVQLTGLITNFQAGQQ